MLSSLTLLGLALTTAAVPLASSTNPLLQGLGPAPLTDPRFSTWSAPGPNDVRSPCPGLNSLANHGFIPHSGKGNTIPILLSGLAAGLNIGPDFTIAIGALGLLSSPNPAGGSFDLNDLDQHNFPIEHDASLSRLDAYFGNDYSFNNATWQQTLAQYKGASMTSLVPAAEAIANRTRNSQATNPTFTYGFQQFILRYGETSLYLQTMGGSDADGVTKLSYVRQMFEQERLPTNLGWSPRAEPITLNSLGQMILELFNVSPDRNSEGQAVLAGSYKDVLVDAVGGSEVLGNLTQGLSKQVGL